MKTYQSNKIVQAAPIVGVPPVTESGHLLSLYVEGPDGTIQIETPSDIATRYHPAPGDYLVKYPDGYMSISPKRAFEEGYVEIGVKEQA